MLLSQHNLLQSQSVSPCVSIVPALPRKLSYQFVSRSSLSPMSNASYFSLTLSPLTILLFSCLFFLLYLSSILSSFLIQTYVTLVELLERARQYRAVLALYRVMVRDGYDFYENTVLNGVFKRLGLYPFNSIPSVPLLLLPHCSYL